MRQVGLLASVLALSLLLRQATADLAAADRTPRLPVVVNTWAFTRATEAAWGAITARDSASPALDAVEQVHLRQASASAANHVLRVPCGRAIARLLQAFRETAHCTCVLYTAL